MRPDLTSGFQLNTNLLSHVKGRSWLYSGKNKTISLPCYPGMDIPMKKIKLSKLEKDAKKNGVIAPTRPFYTMENLGDIMTNKLTVEEPIRMNHDVRKVHECHQEEADISGTDKDTIS